MKKIIVFFAMAIVATAFQVEAAKQDSPTRMPQYIVTDCGTMHQIPSGSSEDFACEMVDTWSDIDCY